jgi:OmpA-OmpF porin, OOP family
MNKFVLAAILPACFLAACTSVLPPTEQSPQSRERITDRAIYADQKALQSLQDKLSDLNKQNLVPVDNFAHSQAQCWLDVAAHEYNRNDRSGFIEHAMGQASEQIAAMQAGKSINTVAKRYPQANGSSPAQPLRPDLWQAGQTFRTQSQFSCSQAKVACMEVRAAHAEHEELQFGWRHSRPYWAIAEAQRVAATNAAASCEEPKAAVVVAAVTPVAPIVKNIQIERFVLRGDAFFAFDKFGIDDLTRSGKASLNDLIASMKTRGDAKSIVVKGFADRIGSDDYNQALSLKRAEAIKRYLVSQQLPENLIKAEGFGATQAKAQCHVKGGAVSDKVKACLENDRRVEIEWASEKVSG